MTHVVRTSAKLPWLLAFGMSVAAGLAAIGSSDRPLFGVLRDYPHVAVVGVLTLAFFAAELPKGLFHVEFRRQAYSYTLASVPLVLGLLTCGVWTTAAMRVLGSLAAFGWQRSPRVKVVYNTAAYVFEVVFDGLLIRLLLHLGINLHLGIHPPVALGLSSAAVLYAAVAATDLVVTALVLLVIRAQTGTLESRQAMGVAVPAVAFTLGSTAAAIGVVLLLAAGPLGGCLLAVAIAIAVVAYRSYQLVYRRHEALALVHDFVQQAGDAEDADQLASDLLAKIRELMSAARVQLMIFDVDAPMNVAVGEDDEPHSMPGESRPSDWLLSRVLEHDEAVLASRGSRDSGLRRWLENRELREAMIVPLPSSPRNGLLLVQDRLGDVATFTRDDLTLLQTLAGHLAVSLQNSHLMQRLRHDASHDALTGLANRVLLRERLVEAIRTEPTRTALILLDLDRFKGVNDTLGHGSGDRLLAEIGGRLALAAPAGSTVARLGGDEFAVLLPPGCDPAEEATLAAGRLTDVLAEPVDLGEATVTMHASVGIAVVAAADRAGDVLRHADTAMYASKAGIGQVVVYTGELDRGRAETQALLADLHLALGRDELELHYQPQLSLTTGRIVGVEALVRWRHPRLGLLFPDAFIPIAEATGLIEQLTPIVLDIALRQCAIWRAQGLDLTVAVNLSARNLANVALPDLVKRALSRWDLPADRLILEITESSVMGDPAQTVPVLHRLTDLGLALSLDDFGTGYSSLSYLQRLPVREVKIDRSFVLGLTDPVERRAGEVLIRAIIGLAASLDLVVVAEGVEDAHNMAFLAELGCDVAQGYHIARPQDAASLTPLLLSAGARTVVRGLTAVSS